MTRVLIVEDNPDNLALICEVILHWGHEVETARDGIEALSRYAEFLPSVVLLDIGLPHLDGYTVARAMKQRPDPPYIIATTGYGQESDRDRALESGCDRHLTKPFSLTVLKDLLAEHTGPARTTPKEE